MTDRADFPTATTWQGASNGPRRGRILLVHGSGSSSSSWHSVGPVLASLGWEVVAVDLPGHGPRRSRGTLEPRSAAEQVRDLTGRTDVALGHSFGAVVASHLAVLGVVERGLILEEPPGRETVDFEAIAQGLEERASEARADPFRSSSTALERLDWPFEDVTRAVSDVARCDARWIASGVRHGASWDIDGLVAGASLPTLLILGPDGKGRFDKDERGSSLRGAERERLLRSASAVEAAIVGQGHCPHREDSAHWVDVVHRFASTVILSSFDAGMSSR